MRGAAALSSSVACSRVPALRVVNLKVDPATREMRTLRDCKEAVTWVLRSGCRRASCRKSLRDCKQAVTLWQRSVAVPSSPSNVVQATCALVEAQSVYQHFSHRDLGGLLAQVVCLLLFCRHAAQNLGTPGYLCHVNADCLRYGMRTAASDARVCTRRRQVELACSTAYGELNPQARFATKGFGSSETVRLAAKTAISAKVFG